MSLLRSFGPVVAHVSPLEAARAGIGAFVGLAVIGLCLLSPGLDLETGLFLVAPMGASAVLLFAVPNSPLAQPWSAIVGNTVAALVGVAVCMLIVDPGLRVALAVGLAVAATILCRAVHPPAGAVAMTAAMSPDTIDNLGFWFAITPIAVGTCALVVLAMVFAKITGRHYPFRQFDDPNQNGTNDPTPVERLGLSETELSNILDRYKQSFNLGVEDLARLIGAAELQAATHTTGPLVASDIMSRNLVSVTPETRLGTVAELFKRHSFTSIPVAAQDATFLGIIFQIHLIGRANDDALRLNRGFAPALRRLLDTKRDKPVLAGDIMNVAGPRATADAPIAALLPMMADGAVDAVPILEHGKIIGIVTRTDLIAAVARHAVRDA